MERTFHCPAIQKGANDGARMSFPLWVPNPISKYVGALLEGDSREPFGFFEALKSSKLRGDLATAASLEADIACLSRLAGVDDDRMRDAYKALGNEFTQDDQWRGFAAAAWSARIDYGRVREQLRKAKELGMRIAKKAGELAGLLEEAGTVHSNWPGELYSMRALLRATNGTDLLWRGLRENVLDAFDGEHDSLLYIWGTAPTVGECLLTMAEAARGFKPVESGIIGAAVGTRQANAKTEYVRAFGEALRERNIPISAKVLKAMAIAMNVALNDPDEEIDVKDVKQALTQSGITQGE